MEETVSNHQKRSSCTRNKIGLFADGAKVSSRWSEQVPAAVDGETGAHDHEGVLGGQEQNGLSYLYRLHGPFSWMLHRSTGGDLLRLENKTCHSVSTVCTEAQGGGGFRFIMNEKTCTHFLSSPWWTGFVEDVRVCDAWTVKQK